MVESLSKQSYKITPLHKLFGALITGLDLSKPEEISRAVRDEIVADVFKYRLLVFRHEGKRISADAQIVISHWFGDI